MDAVGIIARFPCRFFPGVCPDTKCVETGLVLDEGLFREKGAKNTTEVFAQLHAKAALAFSGVRIWFGQPGSPSNRDES